MTTILVYGTKDFCTVATDSQLTNISTMGIHNSFPKVIKVSARVIVAISGSSEAFVKLFGWDDITFPAKKKSFKEYFNEKFSYDYADDCYQKVIDFAKAEISGENTIFICGKSSTGGMFYGKFATSTNCDVSTTVKDSAIIMYGDLPHDLEKSEYKGKYEAFMNPLKNMSLTNDTFSKSEKVIEFQRSFIYEISQKSSFSNNDCLYEVVRY